VEIELDNPRPIIQSYSSKNKQDVNIDFSEGGVVVLNDKSIKGLEFDVVFVMLNGFEIYNNDEDSMRKRLYVMSSRAIKKLIFFQSSENDITKILPSNNILQRKELS
jgi:DNA helicase IV